MICREQSILVPPSQKMRQTERVQPMLEVCDAPHPIVLGFHLGSLELYSISNNFRELL